MKSTHLLLLTTLVLTGCSNQSNWRVVDQNDEYWMMFDIDSVRETNSERILNTTTQFNLDTMENSRNKASGLPIPKQQDSIMIFDCGSRTARSTRIVTTNSDNSTQTLPDMPSTLITPNSAAERAMNFACAPWYKRKYMKLAKPYFTNND